VRVLGRGGDGREHCQGRGGDGCNDHATPVVSRSTLSGRPEVRASRWNPPM
jgi:hypothetical protein